MSSLAAARADNFYYDPGWTPAAGSLNTYHGTHALGKRASKLKSQGILVIRCVSPQPQGSRAAGGRQLLVKGEARWRSLLLATLSARLCVLTPPLSCAALRCLSTCGAPAVATSLPKARVSSARASGCCFPFHSLFSSVGVRFNADKKCIGNYYTTKIWSFTMRAPCCATEVRLRGAL
jgi:hypothetical protein